MAFTAKTTLVAVAVIIALAALPVAAQQATGQRRLPAHTAVVQQVAQPEPDRRPFLMRLFGLGREEPPPAPPPAGAKIINVPAALQRKAPSVVAKPLNPKKDDARVVLVIGDRLAADLGRGLDVAFADRPDIRLETKTIDDGSLADPADLDWKGFLEQRLAAAPRPTVIVAMIGAADARPIVLPNRTVDFPSEDWETIYKARLNELMRVAKEHAVPFHWVGLVPVADSQVTNGITYIDGVIRDEAAEKGATYVDVWEPFSQAGLFVASGPDLDGQVRQLRLKDGIGFTRSGARKLAFYVEQELRAALDVAAPTAALMQSVSGQGLVMLLNDPAAAGEDRLLAAADLKPPKPGTPLYRLTVEGLPIAAIAGRYDATTLR